MCVLCLFNFFAYLFKKSVATILKQVEDKLKALVAFVVWIGDIRPIGVVTQKLPKAEDLELCLTIRCKAEQRLIVVVIHGYDHVEAVEVLLTHLP